MWCGGGRAESVIRTHIRKRNRKIKWILISMKESSFKPITLAALSEAHPVLDSLNASIEGSNPARDTDACPRFSMFCMN